MVLFDTTAESGRRKPYDRDLCWRIVYQRIGMILTYTKIASNLNVSTAQRVDMKFEHTGHVDPVLADRRDTRTLDEHRELHVIGLMHA